MQQQPHKDDRSGKALTVRLDRWVGELNAFLMLFAFGLAVLYGTCFFTMKMSDAILRGGPIIELSPTEQVSLMV